ncbi:unnamed protein product [Urochloa humidicola]
MGQWPARLLARASGGEADVHLMSDPWAGMQRSSARELRTAATTGKLRAAAESELRGSTTLKQGRRGKSLLVGLSAKSSNPARELGEIGDDDDAATAVIPGTMNRRSPVLDLLLIWPGRSTNTSRQQWNRVRGCRFGPARRRMRASGGGLKWPSATDAARSRRHVSHAGPHPVDAARSHGPSDGPAEWLRRGEQRFLLPSHGRLGRSGGRELRHPARALPWTRAAMLDAGLLADVSGREDRGRG